MRSALIILMLTVMGSFMGAARAAAGQPIPAYEATYTGTIGDKRITVFIERFADHLTGSYFYGGNRTNSLALSGTVAGDTFDATETAAGQVTGSWNGRLTPGSIRGTWSSPDKRRVWPLSAAIAPSGKTFPYDIWIVLADGVDRAKVIKNQLLPDACDSSETETQVTGIELIDRATGHAAQTLGREMPEILSQGTCRLFLPVVEDMNFDGWPDLRIARFLPAAPNTPYAAWLFDPTTRNLFFNHDLSNIASPEFDGRNRRVTSTTRDSACCHTNDAFVWNGDRLRLIEETTHDYFDADCYIEKRYRMQNGRLQLAGTHKGCDRQGP
jgi:hypothetical protein